MTKKFFVSNVKNCLFILYASLLGMKPCNILCVLLIFARLLAFFYRVMRLTKTYVNIKASPQNRFYTSFLRLVIFDMVIVTASFLLRFS